MKYLLLLALVCTSCTYSVIMNHTEGTATDVVDETTTPTTEINPNVSVVP